MNHEREGGPGVYGCACHEGYQCHACKGAGPFPKDPSTHTTRAVRTVRVRYSPDEIATLTLTERSLFYAGRLSGLEAALQAIQEEIGSYRAMGDVAPTRVAKLYSIHCREVLESVAEKIRGRE